MEKRKDEYKKPNLLLYGGTWLLSRFISGFLINSKVSRNELKGVSGPCVIMVNHTSSLDQSCISQITAKRITFVMADALFSTVKGAWYFRNLRTVTKQQFRTNYQDLYNMKNVVSHDGMLLIFPAGVFTACGKETTLPVATGKFLKMMGVDVYIIKLHGTYLTKPKWSKIIRRGGVEIEAYKLMTADELQKKTAPEIYAIANHAMAFDDYEWQETARIKYRHGDNVVGLPNILHSCPICKATKCTDVKGLNTIYCKICGFEETADTYCFLHNEKEPEKEIRHISDWSQIVTKDLIESIKHNENFKLEFEVKAFVLDKKKRDFVLKCKATLILDHHRIRLISEEGTEFFNEPASSFPSIPNLPGEFFDLQDGVDIYRIHPIDGMDVMLFVDSVDALFHIWNYNKL